MTEVPKPEGCVARESFETTDKSIGGDKSRLSVIYNAVCTKRIGPYVEHATYHGDYIDPSLTISKAREGLGKLIAARCATCPNNPVNLKARLN